MVNQVYTPNIFITTSFDLVEKILNSNSKNIKTILDSLSENESQYILQSPNSKNSGLTEATINILDSDRSSESCKLTLKFVETTKSFEKLIDSTNYVNFIVDQLATNSLDSLNDLFGKEEFNIYAAYGIGNNLDNWSSFYKFTLIASNITYNEFGIKIITLNFTSSPSPWLRSNKVARRVSRYFTDSNTKFQIPARGTLGMVSEKVSFVHRIEGVSAVVGSSIVRNVGIYDLVNSLSKVLKSYISNVTNFSKQNIIVTLPTKLPFDGKLDFIHGFLITTQDNKELDLASNPDVAAELKNVYDKFYLQISTHNLPDNTSQSDVKVSKLPEWTLPLTYFEEWLKKKRYSIDKDDEYVLHTESNIDILRLLNKYGLIESTDPHIFYTQKKFLDTLYLSNVYTRTDLGQIKSNGLHCNSDDDSTIKISTFASRFKEYSQEYYNLFIDKKMSSSFSVDNVLSDSLAIDEKVKELLENNSIVFTHNFPNSNVLTVDSSIDTYASIYNVTAQRKLNLISSEYQNQNGILEFLNDDMKSRFDGIAQIIKHYYGDNFNPSGVGSINQVIETIFAGAKTYKDYLNKKIKRLEEQEKFFRPQSSPWTNPYGTEKYRISEAKKLISEIERYKLILDSISDKKIAENIDFLATELSELGFVHILLKFAYPNSNLPIVIDTANFKSLITNVFDYDDLIKRLCINIRLKTLPFFSLNFHNGINRVCSLYSFKNNLVGANNNINSLNPFTGTYKIVGIQHFISTNECYSTFDLVVANTNQSKQKVQINLASKYLETIVEPAPIIDGNVPLLPTWGLTGELKGLIGEKQNAPWGGG